MLINQKKSEIIPWSCDKLSFIQRSIEKFLEKWTKKKLKRLKSFQQFEEQEKVINFARWVNRFAAVGASFLSLTGHPKIGGGIGLSCPLIEALFFDFYAKNEAKKREWREFVNDCENLGDNLDRLTLIIQTLKDSLTDRPKLNNYSQRINEKIYDFLKEYDENQDGRVDVTELKIDKFAWNLKKEWGEENIKKKKIVSKSTKKEKKKILSEIVWLARNLQIEIINYRL